MAAMKEQIARHTRAEATTQQQPQHTPDDPLAPKPIRFTHQHGADGVLHKRTVNGPTVGWHLEDGSEGSDAEPPPPRGQASTPSRQTHDYQQQALLTQAYPPDYEDADEPDTRPPRSGIHYQHTLPHQYRGQTVLPTPPQQLRRQRLTGNAPQVQQPRAPRRRNKHWSVYLVTGMATMTALVIGLYSLGSWWQGVQDRWTYGYPRTYQTDAVVGHNHDSRAHPSHFVAVNLKGHLEVFELPAGDPTKVRVFLGPTIVGTGADQVVVTISFADLDHDGTPDLILHYGDSEEVFSNKGGTFLLPDGKSYEQGRSALA
jgi:hypothetical protein